ncbi:Flp family type IVb pilin [Persicimonas caeni]|uniref:Flp family type IVb pilin n=1 Tax=Persicimonas caeni TaxID=2292766 RepID=A0A4Y6PN26_PERCE|nr:Flp family type IVb pilin [Persicimonas caeni]QDG49629.1 Flp family type IVb pilin [Persicimonas caeni]QED30850.1 Flp family type IVb pilin [Persicimonas caeni]
MDWPFSKHFKTFDDDTSGATATEYIILLILIACVIIAIVKMYGSTASKKYKTANDTVRKEVTID